MVKEGAKSYAYGWLDKVMNITVNGKVTNSYSYSMDGQLSAANESGKQESFLWDGLALIKRGTTEYVNEPSVTGGNPILANGKGLFNDILGNSLGVVGEKDKFTAIKRDAFGKTLANPAGTEYNLFTGKPQIGGLGYAFLFRNYRAELGKWQTQDPIGYPDGWNNLAYVNNMVIGCIDRFGTDVYHLVDTEGAGGFGHSAYIIGNDIDGYVAYDYQSNGTGESGSSGSSANLPSRTQGGFTSVAAATAFLNSNRTTEHNYDKGQHWTTTSSEDAAAHTAAVGYMAEDYGFTTHNCYQLGPQAIFNAINISRTMNNDPTINVDPGTLTSPNSAFTINNSNGATTFTPVTE